MEKKITKRERFATLLTLDAVREIPGMIEFLEHEQELLAKKNSADKKPTAQQKLNEEIKDAIYKGMQTDRLYTVTEISKEIPECVDLANQKISALLRQMIPTRIDRVEEKRKAFFRKVVSEE